jgi:hypothetical protein
MKHLQHLLELCRASLAGPLAFLACLSLGLVPASRADEVVYDNTANAYNNLFFPSLLEYGDQVSLGGTGRTVTEFQFEYLGDFPPEQEATVVVRLYDNDGPNPYPTGDFSQPGTLAYESEPVRIYPGYNVLALRGLSVTVSNSITWSVKFGGLTDVPRSRAGLTHYDAPNVGFSYDDFWMKTTKGWQLFSFQGNPPSNFAARIIAAPETPLEIVSTTPNADGTHSIQLQGPAYRSVVLEVSTGQTNWETVRQLLTTDETVTIQDNAPRQETPEYRVRESSTPVLLLSAGRPDSVGRQTLCAIGLPSHGFIVEGTRDMDFWFPIITNDFTGANYSFKDPRSPNDSARYYRAYYVRDVATALGAVSYMTNSETLVNASGPPGRDCVIEWTKDFVHWQSLSTNVFSFTTKTVAFVDPGSTNWSLRFYRIRVAP